MASRSGTPQRARRRRRYSVTGIVGLTMLAGQCAPQQCAPTPAPAPAPAAAPAAPAAAPVQQVVDLTNAARARAGLSAVRVDQRLVNAAQAHSADQAARDALSHAGGDGSDLASRVARQGYAYGTVAENVAAGYRDAASVVDGWMGSAGHQANILNGSVTHVGVGVAYAADGTAYWTQVLAAPG